MTSDVAAERPSHHRVESTQRLDDAHRDRLRFPMYVRPAAALRQDVDQRADGLVGDLDNRRTGANLLFGLQQIDDIAGEVTIRALACDVVRCSIQPVDPGLDPSRALVDGTQHGHTSPLRKSAPAGET